MDPRDVGYVAGSCLFVLSLVCAVTFAIVAIWVGDPRWGYTAVVAVVLGALSVIVAAACAPYFGSRR